ncbi:FAD dependent oxidoreductase [Scleroderma citrinum]
MSGATTEHPPASLPSTNPTLSLWLSPDANPLAREGSEGPLTSDADICIIGSGLTGVGVAYHLSEAIESRALVPGSPLRVVILEARDFCGGATGRNGGNLTPISFICFAERKEQYGIDETMRSCDLEAHSTSSMIDIADRNGWSKDVDMVKTTNISLLLTEDEERKVRTDVECAKSANLSLDGVQWFTKEEVQETFQTHYPAVTRPGCNLWPLKLVTKLYECSKQRAGEYFDLKLHTHTPVTSVVKASPDTNRTWLLSTPRGHILCSRVVHATNGYASHLLPTFAGPNGIVPTRSQVIATRAFVGPEHFQPYSWRGNQDGFAYWFPRPLEPGEHYPLVIMGGIRTAAEPSFERFVDDDSTLNPIVGKALRDFLPTIFEGKFEHGREPEMEWTGIMGYTAMADPFVGPVIDLATGNNADFKGQYISAGYGGHGMPRAFACAEVVAQMIIAELAGREWNHPPWLPKRYLTWNRTRCCN